MICGRTCWAKRVTRRIPYAQMTEVERCAHVGHLIKTTWFAEVYHPDKVDAFQTCKNCGLPPSVESRPCEQRGDQCKPKIKVARSNQIPAWLTGQSTVRNHIFMGGRGSGKSSTAGPYVAAELLTRPNLRAGILGPGFHISVGVGLNGDAGVKTIIESYDKTLIKRFDQVKNILELVNGSTVQCFSSDNPRSVEGHNMHLYWVDEIAELANATGDNCIYRVKARPCCRVTGDKGEPIRRLITGTPDATELIAWFHKQAEEYPEQYAWTQLATMDNIKHLDKEETEQMHRDAQSNEHFYRAKLLGELILESPNALLSEPDLAPIRAPEGDPRRVDVSEFDEIIMTVDSSHADDVKSDECGIHIIGKHGKDAHIIADLSGKMGPDEWGERIIEGLIAYPEIDTLVVEDDSSLVIPVITKALKDNMERLGRRVRVKPVKHGNKSKKARAEPVVVKYVQKRVLHAPCMRTPQWSDLSKLEWQWKSWNPKGRGKNVKSPDRIDSVVYGITYLLLRERQPDGFYRIRF